jgi:hypothetical protein
MADLKGHRETTYYCLGSLALNINGTGHYINNRSG